MPYIGRGSEGFGIRETYQYTATASQTAFTGSDINSKTLKFDNGSLIDVLLNGVMLKPTTDYNTSTANTVTLVSGASTSDELMVIVYDVFALSDALPKSNGVVENSLDMNGTELILDSDGDSSITADTDDRIDFKTAGSDKVSILGGGTLCIGQTAARSTFDEDVTPRLQIEGDGTKATFPALGIGRYSDNAYGGGIYMTKTRGTSFDADTVVQDGDTLGFIYFQGTDGTDSVGAAMIKAEVDGTPGSNDMPGRLVFSTTADAAASPTTRMTIKANGDIGIGTTSPAKPIHSKGGSSNGSIRIEHASNSNYADHLYDGIQANGHLYYISSGDSGGYDNIFYTGSTQTGMLDPNYARFIGATTSTSNSANCQVDGNGRLHTSTSSQVYKKDIEDLTDDYADKIFQLEPKFYKANTDKVGDDLAKYKPDWSFYGLIAEDVEKVEPRLVQYKVAKLKDKENYRDADEFEELETPEPMTVNYSTLTVHLINIVKRFKTRIETLEASNADLIKRVEALEKA